MIKSINNTNQYVCIYIYIYTHIPIHTHTPGQNKFCQFHTIPMCSFVFYGLSWAWAWAWVWTSQHVGERERERAINMSMILVGREMSGVTLTQTHTDKDLVHIMVRNNVLEIIFTKSLWVWVWVHVAPQRENDEPRRFQIFSPNWRKGTKSRRIKCFPQENVFKGKATWAISCPAWWMI